VCRERDADDACDIAQEVCTGDSSTCPPDLRFNEGTVCSSGDSFGLCYSGACTSIEQQCEVYGEQTGTGYTIAETACSSYGPKWQVVENACDQRYKM